MDDKGLRAWGGSFTTGLAFPIAALVEALLVFLTTDVTVGLVGILVLALVPWALLAGQVRVPPWVMAVAGVGLPAVVTLRYDAFGAVFLALLVVAWLAATGESWGAEMVAFTGAVAIPVVFITWSEQWRENYAAGVFFGTGTLFSWLIGRVLRRERQLVAALTEAQDRLDVAAAAAERRRIAHDVHDAIGHGLSVVLLNLVGARQVLARDPVAAAEALDRAEQVGRDSLQSVRGIVGLLRDPGETGAQPPLPGAADIVGLLRSVAAAGLPVRHEVLGDLDSVDSYAGLAAFRVVQEAISNVGHHAPGAEVVARIVQDPEHLVVSVRNTAARVAAPSQRSRGGGTGLDGMRQRVAAVGGTLSAGPDGDGWLVEASLPLRRTDAGVTG
jgi:signal transduction histidine kinase